jgi:hypothetical protein
MTPTNLKHLVLALMMLFATATNGSAAAILIVSGGELMGATGVDVAGTLYDVQFVEGTCPTIFSGCDDWSRFDFPNAESTALAAAQALLDQVFLDTPEGNFDSETALTFGCEHAESCFALTPYSFFGAGAPVAAIAYNRAAGSSFREGVGSALIRFDTTDDPFSVWANWSPSAAQPQPVIPEPSSLILLGTGAVGVVVRMRRGRSEHRVR